VIRWHVNYYITFLKSTLLYGGIRCRDTGENLLKSISVLQIVVRITSDKLITLCTPQRDYTGLSYAIKLPNLFHYVYGSSVVN